MKSFITSLFLVILHGCGNVTTPLIDPLAHHFQQNENSGADCIIQSLPSYAQLTHNKALPDPFTNIDGSRITTKKEWRCRRAEVSKQIQKYELGLKPSTSTTVSGHMKHDELLVTVKNNNLSISFQANITLPKTGLPPYPVIIGMGNSWLNNDALSNQGVAIINFPNNVIADQINRQSRGKGKFYELYGSDHSASAMTAWAWGVSRLIDALEKTPKAFIDTNRIGITGCSRNGKGAIVAGALDERIKLTIPQESGSGGSAAWRISDAQLHSGQNVQTLSQIVTENVWFTENFSQFSNSATKLPFDHHQLLGLIAPRALLVIENTDQEWLGNKSTFGNSVIAHEIWQALGVPEKMGISQVGGHKHCAFPSVQQPELDQFVSQYLIGSTKPTGKITIKTDADFTLNTTDWINWTTPILK